MSVGTRLLQLHQVDTAKAIVYYRSGALPVVLTLTTTFTHRCRNTVPDP